jgi:hypothetical protein
LEVAWPRFEIWAAPPPHFFSDGNIGGRLHGDDQVKY